MNTKISLMRWQEMPDFEIYSDQLITIINQQLSFLGQEVTSTMINNYVKQKVMPLPVKKKYRKEHIAGLMLISILKSAYSLDEISQYFTLYPKETNYDRFCDVFEILWNNSPESVLSCPENTSFGITELLITTVISKHKAIEYLKKGDSHA